MGYNEEIRHLVICLMQYNMFETVCIFHWIDEIEVVWNDIFFFGIQIVPFLCPCFPPKPVLVAGLYLCQLHPDF